MSDEVQAYQPVPIGTWIILAFSIGMAVGFVAGLVVAQL